MLARTQLVLRRVSDSGGAVRVESQRDWRQLSESLPESAVDDLCNRLMLQSLEPGVYNKLAEKGGADLEGQGLAQAVAMHLPLPGGLADYSTLLLERMGLLSEECRVEILNLAARQ